MKKLLALLLSSALLVAPAASTSITTTGAGVGRAPLTTLTFVSGTGVDAASITIPVGGATGDFAVIYDMASNADCGTAPTTPTGWTQIFQKTLNLNSGDPGDCNTITAWGKILAAGEPGSSITGSDWTTAAGARRKIVQVFRPGPSVAVGFTINDLQEQTGIAGDPTSQTIASATGPVPLVTQAMYRGAAGGYTQTHTPAQDGETASGTTAFVRYKIYTSSPANITAVDMTDSGIHNSLLTYYVTFN
jgi:hypothetical protein